MFNISISRQRQLLVLGLLCLAFISVRAQEAPSTSESTEDQKESREDSLENLKRRQEWFNQQRRFPLDRIPEGARRRALEQMRQMREADLLKGESLSGEPGLTQSWIQVGPQPANSYWGVSSGRATSIIVDPRNKDVAYLGTAGGGVWKTVNGGNSWIPLTDTQPTLSIGALAFDPANPDIIWVGTGEENISGDSYYGEGILKSVDGGSSWTQILGPFKESHIGSIAIEPGNSNVILAATLSYNASLPFGGAVMRSTDGGLTWSVGLSGMADAVVFDPTNGNIVYAGLGMYGDPYSGIYKSTDAGKTWTKLTNGLPAGTGRIGLAHAPTTGIVYAAVADSLYSPTGIGGIYTTVDGGASWTKVSDAANCCTWYENGIAVDPANANVIYTGAFNTSRSLDGGATWTVLGGSHPDQHGYAFSHDGTRLYAANDGGAWSIDGPDGSTVSWNSLNTTIATINFYPGLGVDDNNPQRFFAGTQDTGSLLYTGLLPWANNNPYCGDSSSAVIDPALPYLMYDYCIGTLYRSTNGTIFASAMTGIDTVNDGGGWVAPISLSRANPQTLYYGAKHLYQTKDGAATWTQISSVFSSNGSVSAIAAAPSSNDVVYVGVSSSQVYLTQNASAGALATWAPIITGLPNAYVTHFAVNQTNASIAYVTFSGFGGSHVFKTTDMGSHWTNISGNLPNIPVNDIVIDPTVVGTLYIATDIGTFFSTNDGTSWSVLGVGLPNVVVQSISLQNSSRTLFAITHGRSSWTLFLPTAGSSLTLTSPNGGESWQMGTQHTIQWNYAALGGNINIILQRAGVDYRTVATVPAGSSGSGSYVWKLPTDLQADSTYSLRIASALDPSIADSSNAQFSITSPSILHTVSPNGSEKWLIGSTYAVKWNFSNVSGNVNLVLLQGGAFAYNVATVPVGTGGVGSFNWTIPTFLFPYGSDYSMRIESAADPTVFDVSDNTFSITGNIHVTSPNGGEVWLPSSQHDITWDFAGNGDTVAIALLKAGVGYRSIAFVPMYGTQSGSYTWTVPPDLPLASDYQIRVMDTSVNSILDVSDAKFATASITVTSPNGGEIWAPGSLQTIKWNYLGLTGNVNIELVSSSQNLTLYIGQVGIGTGGSGSYAWTVPSTLPLAPDYKILVSSVSYPAVSDLSNANFSTTRVSLQQPIGGEQWAAGAQHNIKWTPMAGNVNIVLLKSNVGYSTIATVPGSSGVYLWNIPTTLPISSDYKIRVMSAVNTSVYSISANPFSITPGVAVLWPNGGNSLMAGSQQLIQWKYDGVSGNVNLTLLKGGAGYQSIATNVAVGSGGNGSFNWNVPINLPISSDYQIRVMSASNSSIYDASDSTFSVAPGIKVTSANGGESWTVGSTQVVQWKYDGATGNVNIALLKAGIGYDPIASNVPVGAGGTGSYNWPIPYYETAGSDYTIRVMSASNSSIIDVSDANFSLAASVRVTSANGGETWARGSSHTIQWTYGGITGNVDIALLKNELGYDPIATNVPIGSNGTGSFTWIVPSYEAIGSDYKIRIICDSNTLILDESDGTFSISGP